VPPREPAEDGRLADRSGRSRMEDSNSGTFRVIALFSDLLGTCVLEPVLGVAIEYRIRCLFIRTP
jgi:hypothetical protein